MATAGTKKTGGAARADAPQDREGILATATDWSTQEGLSGLTIGVLADRTGLSKSGLFAKFGSKEALQLAVISYAAQRFAASVLEPAGKAEPGLPRLRALFDSWLLHVERSPYRGGCFFDAASAEFSSRPGAIRDRLARISRSWIAALREQAHLARRLGELPDDGATADEIAFALLALTTEANRWRELFADSDASEELAPFARAREAADRLLASSDGSSHVPERSRRTTK